MKAAAVNRKFHYRKELEHPAVAKEMEMKSDCNMGKSGSQAKATSEVAKVAELTPSVMTILQEPIASDEETAVDAIKTAIKDSESVREKRVAAEVIPGEQEDEEVSLTESEGQLAGRDGWESRFDGSEAGERDEEEDEWSQTTIAENGTPTIGMDQFNDASGAVFESPNWSETEGTEAQLVVDISEREVAGKAFRDSVTLMRTLAAQLGPKESSAMKSFFIGTAKSIFDGGERPTTRNKKKNWRGGKELRMVDLEKMFCLKAWMD